jgi:hypothetical protein
VLEQFFSASRLRDTTALRRLATTIFEPLQQGIVTEFAVQDIRQDAPDRRTVTIAAPVTMPDGTIVERTLVATLQRGVLHESPDDERRWIVTAIRMD